MTASKDSYKRYYVLALLFCIATLNFVDRQLIAIASPLLKAEMAISDTELGLLKGFAFALLYSLVGIPIARLADRASRVNIITIALTLWSAMTIITGLAGSFLHLLLARIGLGIGEAGCAPSSHSLLSSYFAKQRLHTALSVFSLGIPMGNMIAFLVGSLLMAEMGWRFTFIFFGGLGLLLAILFKLTTSEPPRLHASDQQHNTLETVLTPVSLRQSIAQLMAIPSYRWLCIGSGFVVVGTFGLVNWAMDFFVRNHSLSITDAGFQLALIYGIGGSCGVLLGGFLCDRFGAQNKAFYLIIPGVALLFSAPLLAAAVWSTSSQQAFILLGIAILFVYIYQGPSYALAQMLAPPALRAQSSACVIFVQIVLGTGFGPLIVGMASDMFTPVYGNETSLRLALSLLCIAITIAGLVFIHAAKKLNDDLA